MQVQWWGAPTLRLVHCHLGFGLGVSSAPIAVAGGFAGIAGITAQWFAGITEIAASWREGLQLEFFDQRRIHDGSRLTIDCSWNKLSEVASQYNESRSLREGGGLQEQLKVYLIRRKYDSTSIQAPFAPEQRYCRNTKLTENRPCNLVSVAGDCPVTARMPSQAACSLTALGPYISSPNLDVSLSSV